MHMVIQLLMPSLPTAILVAEQEERAYEEKEKVESDLRLKNMNEGYSQQIQDQNEVEAPTRLWRGDGHADRAGQHRRQRDQREGPEAERRGAHGVDATGASTPRLPGGCEAQGRRSPPRFGRFFFRACSTRILCMA